MQRNRTRSPIRSGRRLFTLLVLAVTLIACSDEDQPTDPAPVPVASVAVKPQADEVPVGQTLQFSAVALAANGDTLQGHHITWSSSNENVATVSTTGLLTAHAGGVALIEAKTGTKAGSANITVVNPAPTITTLQPATVQSGSPAFLLTVTGAHFTPGSVVYFNGFARPTTYVSATELRAGISAPDIEFAGNATVRVSTPLPGGGQSGNAMLTITPGAHEVASVDVSPPNATLWLGEQVQLNATPRDALGRPIPNATVVWQTSNSSVLMASANGMVTGVGNGTARIDASVAGKLGNSLINVWSMQSTYDIVYQAPDVTGMQTLFVVSPGLFTAPRRLLPAGMNGFEPAVTQDGNRVAFTSADMFGNMAIHVVDRDGSNLRRITQQGVNARPVWSPDGSKIAFESLRNGYRDIFVINADGTNEVNLTYASIRVGAPQHTYPSWSPDGATIVFSLRDANVQPSYSRIVAMNANGTGMRPLSSVAGYSDVEPSFSRDGTIIAYRRHHPQFGDQIAFMTPTGEGLHYLFPPGSGHQPKWAPNGQWLTFISGETISEPSDVYIWKLGEQGRKRITLTGGASNPAWIRR